jgi:hypothetical protein
MRNLHVALAGVIFALAVSTAAAGVPDNAVKAQLDAKGIKYQIDKDGDFRIVYQLDGGRSQVAWVRSAINSYGSLKIREIWSPGYRSEGNDFPARIANDLLARNHQVKLGAWEAQKNVAMFVVKIPADASADQLVDAVAVAVDSADEVEKEITGSKDEF